MLLTRVARPGPVCGSPRWVSGRWSRFPTGACGCGRAISWWCPPLGGRLRSMGLASVVAAAGHRSRRPSRCPEPNLHAPAAAGHDRVAGWRRRGRDRRGGELAQAMGEGGVACPHGRRSRRSVGTVIDEVLHAAELPPATPVGSAVRVPAPQEHVVVRLRRNGPKRGPDRLGLRCRGDDPFASSVGTRAVTLADHRARGR